MGVETEGKGVSSGDSFNSVRHSDCATVAFSCQPRAPARGMVVFYNKEAHRADSLSVGKELRPQIRNFADFRVDIRGRYEIMRGSIVENSGIRTSKMTTKTYMAKNGELTRKWFVVDISGKVLGRAATKIATVLMGKHRPEYTPHVDTGDFVIVINAADVRVTGNNKLTEKIYKRYTGYPSGLKLTTLEDMLKTYPERVISEAVRRMLPKGRLGRAMLRKLKVFPGSEHCHQAQQPEKMEI